MFLHELSIDYEGETLLSPILRPHQLEKSGYDLSDSPDRKHKGKQDPKALGKGQFKVSLSRGTNTI